MSSHLSMREQPASPPRAALLLMALIATLSFMLAFPGHASAHEMSYVASHYCDGTWDTRAEFGGSTELVLIALSNVKINEQLYQTRWSLLGGMTASTTAPGEGFSTATPSPGTVYWRGTSSGGAGAGVLFHRSGLSSIPGSWDGWIQTYKIEQRAGVPLPGARWRPDGAARKMTEPAPSTRCITVKKVVTNVRDDRNAFSGSATHPFGAWRFTGLRETAPGRSWGPTFYSTFTVSEDVSPGYILQGYLAIRGLDASCPADPPESRLKRLPITFVISAANPAMTVCVYNRRSAVA
ncbi:hypothetical protein [Candidatus Amarobacter glycogenicus]|uniref:hypothetical protein n=1 Tax=Candidatus Amarobacter glycogenicus TaxID=3140699 RepID=UPI003134D159|nr:hypothetical protein [Dehalococcoidia bacterium]